MIGAVSIAAMIFTLLICFGLPVGLAIWFFRKEHYAVAALIVGAVVFLVSQVFIRIPILNAISGMRGGGILTAAGLLFRLNLGSQPSRLNREENNRPTSRIRKG